MSSAEQDTAEPLSSLSLNLPATEDASSSEDEIIIERKKIKATIRDSDDEEEPTDTKIQENNSEPEDYDVNFKRKKLIKKRPINDESDEDISIDKISHFQQNKITEPEENLTDDSEDDIYTVKPPNKSPSSSRNTSPEPKQDSSDESESDLVINASKDISSEKPKKLGPSRKSKLSALEEIRSETQRLIRQSNLSLPYHMPKQKSLAEFLNRRKATLSHVPLLSTSDELTKVWQHLEEREKTIEDFYKSEGEEETQDTSSEVPKLEENPEPEHLEHDNVETLPKNDNKEEKNDFSQRMEMFLAELDGRKSENIEKVPKLLGDPDEMIEFDEDNETSSEGLIKRFIKHVMLKPKTNNKEKLEVTVMSSVVDKGEVTDFTEETLSFKTDKAPKPGEKLVVLKSSLKQKMAIIREQQMAKKIEEFKLNEEEYYAGEKNDCADELDFDEDIEFENEIFGTEEIDEDKLEDDKDQNPFIDDKAEEDEDDGNQVEDCGDIGDDDETDIMNKSWDLGDNSQSSNSDEDCQDEKEENMLPFSVPKLNKDLESNDDLEDLCSGTFQSHPVNLTDLEKDDMALGLHFKSTQDTQTDSFKNDSDSDEEIIGKKKKNFNLALSDDEDENENQNETIEEDYDNEEVLEEEEEEEEEEFEDEETELARKISKGYLDGEAELSGSEIGSGDEDEKDLDEYEEEEGDLEKVNARKLQKELGKIHMKEVLAEDKREIRILQELLLEDGELHTDGPKRQRLFRWYNQDNLEFGDSDQKDEGTNEFADDEDEETWRKERIQRENFLKQKKIDNLNQEYNSESLNISMSTIVKPVAKPTNPISTYKPMTSRGSFLARGDKILSKLAQITASSNKENPTGNSVGRKNMVFAALSPPKDDKIEAPLKRKENDEISRISKRIKFISHNNTNQMSIFEKLKQTDMAL